MHEGARRFIAGTVACFGLELGSVIDLGGRDINGTVHSLFVTKPFVIDIAPGPGVDVVADAADWVPDREFDVVLCTEVLEHTPRWPGIIRTAHNALRPGGVLILTCATHGRPPHGAATTFPLEGEYYANVDPDAVALALDGRGFRQRMVRVASGEFLDDDLYCWAVK